MNCIIRIFTIIDTHILSSWLNYFFKNKVDIFEDSLAIAWEEVLGPKAINEYPYTLVTLVNICYILLLLLTLAFSFSFSLSIHFLSASIVFLENWFFCWWKPSRIKAIMPFFSHNSWDFITTLLNKTESSSEVLSNNLLRLSHKLDKYFRSMSSWYFDLIVLDFIAWKSVWVIVRTCLWVLW